MIEAVSIIISVAATILFAGMVYVGCSKHRDAMPIVAFMLVLLILVGLTS